MRQARGREIASHGLRWIEYGHFAKADERIHVSKAVRIHTEVTGERPLEFYHGRCSVKTLNLTMAEGGVLYSADSYADDLPYWIAGPA
jgi:peptidoglycan/xylan/chitin deacetylase (PgdA/CDA1 family)